jgi:DNA-binding HxlR family transcriptional regulator
MSMPEVGPLHSLESRSLESRSLESRSDEELPAPIGAEEALRLLQSKYTLGVLRALLTGPHKFSALQQLAGARSATTLQDRLKALSLAGVVDRRGNLYELTPQGQGLSPLFSELDRFTARFRDLDAGLLLAALQRRHAIRIMRELMPGALGFNELRRAVGAASATTLARRLSDLEAIGLIDKAVHSQMPPRTSYAHSQVGRAFSEVVGQIVAWGEQIPVSVLRSRRAEVRVHPDTTDLS